MNCLLIRRRDAPYIPRMNGGELLYEQMVRVTKNPPGWEKLPVPLRQLYEAVAQLKLAFVHHTSAPDAHGKPANGPNR